MPVAVIIMSLSFLSPNLMSAINLEGIYNTFSGAITIILSLLILDRSSNKKKSEKRRN